MTWFQPRGRGSPRHWPQLCCLAQRADVGRGCHTATSSLFLHGAASYSQIQQDGRMGGKIEGKKKSRKIRTLKRKCCSQVPGLCKSVGIMMQTAQPTVKWDPGALPSRSGHQGLLSLAPLTPVGWGCLASLSLDRCHNGTRMWLLICLLDLAGRRSRESGPACLFPVLKTRAVVAWPGRSHPPCDKSSGGQEVG